MSYSILLSLISQPNPPTPNITTLSLHDALPIFHRGHGGVLHVAAGGIAAEAARESDGAGAERGVESVRVVERLVELRSDEHTFELQSGRGLVCRLLLEKQKGCVMAMQCIRYHRS